MALATVVPLVLPTLPAQPTLLASGAALLGMALSAWAGGAVRSAHVPLLFGLVFVWGGLALWPSAWPLQILVPFLVYLFLAWTVPDLRATASWRRKGAMDGSVVRLSVIAVAVPTLALVLWVALLQPDLSRWTRAIPAWSPAPLLGGILLFSLVNAALEESLYRGVLLEGLDAVLGRGALPVLLQALAFGAIHLEGVPNGWAGVAMATFYGVLLGMVCRASGGLLAPILVHVAADLVIVGILVVAS